MTLMSNWDVHAGNTFSKLTESYCDRCTRGGPLVRASPGLAPWAGFNSDGRKRVYGGFWVNLSYGNEGKSRTSDFNPYITIRLSSAVNLNLSADFNRAHDDMQWFGNYTDSTTTHYSFAHLDQRTTSMSARLNYTMTPTVTLELYAQPFASTGTYSNVRELSANPRAESYADRFQPFTPPTDAAMQFKVTELITNSVLRWEYRPGSTLFVVWQHGRQGPGANNRFDQQWTTDYRELFSQHPDNTFLVKLAYWLAR
jgi:hypothetical protein